MSSGHYYGRYVGLAGARHLVKLHTVREFALSQSSLPHFWRGVGPDDLYSAVLLSCYSKLSKCYFLAFCVY